jgi:signal transduction histidine kinase
LSSSKVPTKPEDAPDVGRTADLKRRFLSAVAHELRTPLTVIKTFITVLERGTHGPVTRDQSEVLEHVQIEADRLAHEIDKLLSLARLESEDFAPDRTSVTVAELLRPIEKRLRARAREVRVDLLIRMDDPKAQVFADPQDISRVLLALTENALKFTAEGGRVVLHAAPHGSEVRFEVLDSGIGIDPRHHEHIFEMFAQVENPLTRRFKGAGIGLSYAARIVEAHASRIEVTSRLGDGSLFSFQLPSAPEVDTQGVTSASADRIGIHV